MKIRKIQAAILATGLVGVLSGHAAQLDVCSACAHTTITDAVSAAASGDVIYIHNGTYNEHDIVIDKELTVNGESQAGVVVDAGGNGRHFSVMDAAGVARFSEMTLENGTTVGSSNPCNNFAHNRGGSICAGDVAMKIWKVAFNDNFAEAIGGAVYMGGDTAGQFTTGVLSISKSIFNHNSLAGTTSNGATGGAVACGYCESVEMFGNVFNRNTAGTMPTSSGTYHGQGGAVGIFGASKVRSDQNIFKYNHAKQTGGAVNVSATSATFTNDFFFKNHADIQAGALLSANAGSDPTVTHIRRSTFEKNYSEHGGALDARSEVRIDNSTFTDNFAASNGAAIIQSRAYETFKVANTTFVRNEAYGDDGAVIYFSSLYNSGDIRIDNSLFFDNPDPECQFDYNDIAEGVHNLGDSYSCDPANGSGLPFILSAATDVNPNLVNNGGFTKTHELLAGSNAVDTGANSCPSAITGSPLANDQRGFNRPKKCDIGSYEQ
ncbi:MAG: choice-of-anchor Q domain-containing protein [Pseudomonadota bacterium]